MATAAALYGGEEQQAGPDSSPLAEDQHAIYQFTSPLLTPRSCHSVACNGTDSSGVCPTCSHRRQRSRLVWAVLCVWAIPLALAGARWSGVIGPGHHHGLNKDPRGSLLLAQVIFRHGARTPLSNMYWPNSTWSHCSQHPLAGAAASSSSGSSSSSGISLQLYDPSGAPNPPELSGDEEPQLPGGCRMGSLTDVGFQNALDLGAQLRHTYINQHKLLPSRQLDTRLLHAESTAVQRTVTTLRGVLSGLYPNSTARVVRVAVRPYAEETMTADRQGCAVLGNLTQRLADEQKAQDAIDPAIQQLESEARSALQLPPDAALLWNRLRDELVCMAAEGQLPDAAETHQALVKRIDYVTTRRGVELYGPELGHCLLGRDQQQQCQEVTALTSGRLLNTFITNMHTAAAAAAAAAAYDSHSDRWHSTSSSSSIKSSTAGFAAARRLLAAAAASANRSQPSASGDSTPSGGGSGGNTAAPRQVHAPKLMLYAAHDTTILPLLSALGQHQTTWPVFTSHLAFELWVHRGQHYVRVLYDGEPLELPLRDDTGAGSSSSGGGRAQLSASIPYLSYPISRAADFARGLADGLAGLGREVLGAAAKWCAAVTGSRVDARSSSSGVQSNNGQGARGGAAGSAYVVSLRDFAQRVVKDYVLTPKEYASACSAAGAVAEQGGASRQQWLAQFY